MNPEFPTPAFVNDGVQWLNVGKIDVIVDSTRTEEPHRIVVIRGREYLSPGTADGLIAMIESVVNPVSPFDDKNDPFPPLDKPRFAAPGRGIPD